MFVFNPIYCLFKEKYIFSKPKFVHIFTKFLQFFQKTELFSDFTSTTDVFANLVKMIKESKRIRKMKIMIITTVRKSMKNIQFYYQLSKKDEKLFRSIVSCFRKGTCNKGIC